MKKTIFIVFINFLFAFSFGQINTELIKKNVTENPQENFYPLLEKFKINPSELSQEQLNQLYYGSKFVKSDYSISDFNKDYEKLWKLSGKRLSKSKAEKIRVQAEEKYQKNPLDREILDNMTNIYNALDEKQKADLCQTQKELIINTIEKSGDGKTEETPICVIRPGDVIRKIGFGTNYKTKGLEDGSDLTVYEINGEKNYIKLVGGYY